MHVLVTPSKTEPAMALMSLIRRGFVIGDETQPGPGSWVLGC